ncbi:hypothetical protein KOW79_012392 [Hemibagrus wyckioides]|uniref:Uncharacterized protein n=1 Tax=Hemibagrus wyckioides TaxID=337641 RepID=A0A9D3NKQ5_9TELE|nr:hypothetical protein KOW79_012392 [Hemibagrus wyckioides]
MQSSGAFCVLLLRWRHRQMGLAAEQQRGVPPDLPGRTCSEWGCMREEGFVSEATTEVNLVGLRFGPPTKAMAG